MFFDPVGSSSGLHYNQLTIKLRTFLGSQTVLFVGVITAPRGIPVCLLCPDAGGMPVDIDSSIRYVIGGVCLLSISSQHFDKCPSFWEA